MSTVNERAEASGILGIGYEGRSLDDFIGCLSGHGTAFLADVRLNPVSRKRGFSKRLLAAALAEAGISYWHVPELGNPRWNRDGFSGPPAEVAAARARYAAMIGSEEPAARLAEIAQASLDSRVAVMCVEADETACHRYVVLRELERVMDACGTT